MATTSHHGASQRYYVCSRTTTVFFSALGFVSPALVCFLLLSSFTLLASSTVRLRWFAL